jgi:YD repeat-containing protein
VQAEEWEAKRAGIEDELCASAQRVADLEGSLELSRGNSKQLEAELDESMHAHQLTRNELEALQERTLNASGQLDETVSSLLQLSISIRHYCFFLYMHAYIHTYIYTYIHTLYMRVD